MSVPGLCVSLKGPGILSQGGLLLCPLGEGVAGSLGLGVERELRRRAWWDPSLPKLIFQPTYPVPWPDSFPLTATGVCLAERSA